MYRYLLALGVVLLLGTAVGCFDPCDRLANKICDCEDNEILRQQCVRRVDVQKEQRDPTDDDRKACEAALETCTCDALDNLDLKACGFSR